MKTRHVPVTPGDVVLLVGTAKGLFVLRAAGRRRRWELGGPYQAGRAVYTAALDTRAGRQRLWAGVASLHWGAVISRSDDWGRTWHEPPEANVRFPAESGLSLKQVWQITPGRADEPDRLFAGVEPAALFESTDAGATWTPVRGLLDHPHRERWQPGGGGLCLHTIVPDATNRERMWIAISTGGVYRTEDGGRSWVARNKGIRAEFLPDQHPEFGQCVHKVVQHPARPDTLYAQNHWGLYRSDDGGDVWHDIARGVPSDFGFGMAIHPRAPDTVYIVPLESDMFRCVPEARLRVYRTRDGGRSWHGLARGLPQRNAYETVLRDALATDGAEPAGVYVGTRSGKVYASRDEGASWTLVADGLPPVLCVRAVIAPGKPRAPRPRRPTRQRTRARRGHSAGRRRRPVPRPVR
ncbi:MAG TPA: exo-alpha-sialidase [Methylomirabilota bacterium]|jgi:photosystem II stability/assembly factor-like uncharacterized protein|nr:exo-alpha-sialidase [Methylomirabilota bacterium]